MTGSPARGLLAAVRFYQRAISPAFPPRCRFEPTCSAYAAEAIEVHGAGRGSWLAVCRLAKCAPWHRGGVDLVPPRRGASAPPGDAGREPGPGTAGPTHSSCTAAQPPAPSAATASTADGTRRPDRATPPAPRRSAQQEAGVA